MTKYLVILVVIGVVWALWRQGQGKGDGSPQARGRARPGSVAQEMVGCAHCGLHLPRYRVADLGMNVKDGYRGQGVGSALVERALLWAREVGAHKIALQHWPHNTAARALYEKYGFEQEGYLRRHYPRNSGEIWDAVVMGLLLDD